MNVKEKTNKMENAKMSPETVKWKLTIWQLFGVICKPVTIVPLLLYNFYHKIQRQRFQSRIRDKVVLITGASSGLGEALAHVFYCAGCRVILSSRRESELERVRQSLLTTYTTGTTHPPVVLPLDLSDLKALPDHIAKALAIFGHIDILINNGGISYRGNVLTTNIDVDIKLMLVNYFGQVALTKAVLPSMIERQSGHIVAVSSVQGRIAIPYRSAYAASKHALQGFCDTLRSEVAAHNVKVTVVSPGYIRTALSLNAITGSGQSYGVLDETTAHGYLPSAVAEQIFDAVIMGKKELIVSPALPQLAIFIRTVFPSLYFWLMEGRAERLKQE